MFSHSEIWAAIDRLASKHSLSTSGLAKRAGLDPTTFNKSKRQTAHGKPRWPSTESIAKILGVTSTNLTELADLVRDDHNENGESMGLPCVKLSSLTDARLFNGNDQPTGLKPWKNLTLPVAFPTTCFAIEVDGAQSSECYRKGDILIAETVPAKSLNTGERAVMHLESGLLLAGEVMAITPTMIEVKSMDSGDNKKLYLKDIALTARVLWVSQ